MKTVLMALVGLFVDDAGLAVATLAWVAIAALALPRFGLPPALPPLLLFAGLAVILADSVRRGAKLAAGGHEAPDPHD